MCVFKCVYFYDVSHSFVAIVNPFVYTHIVTAHFLTWRNVIYSHKKFIWYKWFKLSSTCSHLLTFPGKCLFRQNCLFVQFGFLTFCRQGWSLTHCSHNHMFVLLTLLSIYCKTRNFHEQFIFVIFASMSHVPKFHDNYNCIIMYLWRPDNCEL